MVGLTDGGEPSPENCLQASSDFWQVSPIGSLPGAEIKGHTGGSCLGVLLEDTFVDIIPLASTEKREKTGQEL